MKYIVNSPDAVYSKTNLPEDGKNTNGHDTITAMEIQHVAPSVPCYLMLQGSTELIGCCVICSFLEISHTLRTN
jgi:hypothetical protein